MLTPACTSGHGVCTGRPIRRNLKREVTTRTTFSDLTPFNVKPESYRYHSTANSTWNGRHHKQMPRIERFGWVVVLGGSILGGGGILGPPPKKKLDGKGAYFRGDTGLKLMRVRLAIILPGIIVLEASQISYNSLPRHITWEIVLASLIRMYYKLLRFLQNRFDRLSCLA